MLSPEDLRRRTSAKWREHPADVLPLWVAEMDVPLARPVIEALTAAIDLGDTGYATGTGYAESVAGFAATRWDWELDIAHTSLVPDVMQGAVAAFDLVTGPGDAVVVNPPVYPPFFPFIENAGRRVLEAPLGADLRLDLEALDRAFAQAVSGGRRAAYLLCSPHNPTGTVHTGSELTAVAELAAAHGVRVVVDEIHAPLVRPGVRFVPYLSRPETGKAFALVSASKGWNLPGLKAALLVAGREAAEDLARMPDVVTHGTSHLGVIAHTAAFRDGGAWLDEVLGAIDHRTHLLADLLSRQLPGVHYQPGAGTYLAWLDCRSLGWGDDPAATFLERGRVALLPGPDFGTGGTGHVRLNLATSSEILTEAVRRMAAAVPTT